MVTRRTDARRRRVLSEEFVPTDEAAVAETDKPMVAYAFGANRRNQPKTTDLIPKRSLALSLFFALLASIVAAINALAWFNTPLTEILGENGARSLAMLGPGTLANWFSSVCLFLCAGICLQLFLMRKHKRDDYGGMYRVWILMAAMFLLASIDCAIDLRTIVAKLFEFMTLRSLLQTPWLLMTIELIVLGIIVIRMLFEVRSSKFSLAAVLLVWLGFVGCIVLRNVELPANVAWLDQKTAHGNCILLGCVGSLAALTVYARFVFLHAHGLIQPKVRVVSMHDAEHEQTETAGAQPAKTSKPAKTIPISKKAAKRPAPAKPVAQPTAAEPSTPKPAVTKAATNKPAAAAKAKTASPLAQKQRQAKAAKAAQSAPTQRVAANQPTKAAQKKATAQQKTDFQEENDFDDPDTIPLSKSERRRQRKLAKRAARAKKAA